MPDSDDVDDVVEEAELPKEPLRSERTRLFFSLLRLVAAGILLPSNRQGEEGLTERMPTVFHEPTCHI